MVSNTPWDYFARLPWRDWATTIIAGFFVVLGTIYTAQQKNSLVKREHKLDDDRATRAAEITLDIAQTQDLTARFTALMNGYEARIRDLSTELVSTRGELKGLREALDKQQGICRRCPMFRELEKTDDAS